MILWNFSDAVLSGGLKDKRLSIVTYYVFTITCNDVIINYLSDVIINVWFRLFWDPSIVGTLLFPLGQCFVTVKTEKKKCVWLAV